MVSANSYHDGEDVTRSVYTISHKFDLMDRTTAIDANDPIVVLGFGNKGYVAPYYKDAHDKQNVSNAQ